MRDNGKKINMYYNPETGRYVKENGKIYRQLIRKGVLKPKLIIEKPVVNEIKNDIKNDEIDETIPDINNEVNEIQKTSNKTPSDEELTPTCVKKPTNVKPNDVPTDVTDVPVKNVNIKLRNKVLESVPDVVSEAKQLDNDLSDKDVDKLLRKMLYNKLIKKEKKKKTKKKKKKIIYETESETDEETDLSEFSD